MCGVYSKAMRSRRGPRMGVAWSPRIVSSRQMVCGFGAFTLSDGVCCGSGPKTTGATWWWPPRCGVIHFS